MRSTGKIPRAALRGAFIVLLTFALPSHPAAVTLSPGDILVTDATGSGALIRINAVTGAQTVVSSAGFFVDPIDVAIAPNGQIFVLDVNAFGGPGGVIRVDPVTGAQTVVSSGGFFVDPFSIAIAANGDILVVDVDAFGGPGGVIRVDPVTGAQTVVSSGGFFVHPSGVTIAPNGDILVADANTFGVPPFNVIPGGVIIRVNPATGAQTIISSGGSFFDPFGIDLDAAGQILVADFNSFAGGGHACGGGIGALFRINPTTGAQTVVAVGGPFTIAGVSNLVAPFGRVAIEADGNILVNAGNVFGQFTGVPLGGSGFCSDAPAAIFRVNPTTGAVTLLSLGGLLLTGGGMAVASVITVAIDIKPGSFPNSVNPNDRGVIPVAILTTGTFDASTVDPTTVRFGRAGTEAAPRRSALEDVDRDGDTDMILHFVTQNTGIVCGDTSASLTGKTFSGQAIKGSDSIRTVGCN